MNDVVQFELPNITDKDISGISSRLSLPANAFYGMDGTDPRQVVLKSMEHLDIAACPGSGKTTLLVAKLAILADKWQYRTRGICVVSHTNVARNEIEARLGNTTTGRRLLSYPHYIGTIHGFANEFLAVPWLRSIGYPIKMIDNEISQKRRWYSLADAIRTGLEKNHHSHTVLSCGSSDFSIGELRWGRGLLGTDTPTYTEIRRVCRDSALEGYFCHDEMFVWANDLIDKVPGISKLICDRFPMLFVDEAQDNSEHQSAILHRIFVENEGSAIRQRFGDENQAIFDAIFLTGASTYKFPINEIRKELPNSYRFGQKIANLADPLGLVPYGLKGHGPKKPLDSGTSEGGHTVFLFDDSALSKVLDAYAELLIETFSDAELRNGSFVAIGQVHRPPEELKKQHIPHHIGNYWPEYDPELAKQNPKPQTFIQYVLAGQAQAETIKEVYPAVEKIAEGVLRLSGMGKDGPLGARRMHRHRFTMELLQKCIDVRGRYEELLTRFAVNREILTKEAWNNQWCGVVKEIAEKVIGQSLSGPGVESFLEWRNELGGHGTSSAPTKRLDNFYRYPKDNPKVNIRVGSIHSVKGETHTATLVMETYWYQHNLEGLLPWLRGRKSGGQGEKDRLLSRLKLHYVAMTRPAHLLCLAIKRSSVTKEMEKEMDQHGWQIRSI